MEQILARSLSSVVIIIIVIIAIKIVIIIIVIIMMMMISQHLIYTAIPNFPARLSIVVDTQVGIEEPHFGDHAFLIYV